MYQTRQQGLCVEHPTLKEALQTPNEKVSFETDGCRVILRSDGTWEVWTMDGRWFAEGFVPWFKKMTPEDLAKDLEWVKMLRGVDNESPTPQ